MFSRCYSYYTDLSFEYIYANMPQEQFQQVIAEAKAKSLANYNVPVTSEDQILTPFHLHQILRQHQQPALCRHGKAGLGGDTVHHHQYPHQPGGLQR